MTRDEITRVLNAIPGTYKPPPPSRLELLELDAERAQERLAEAGIVLSDADDYFGLEFCTASDGARLDAADIAALPLWCQQDILKMREAHEAYIEAGELDEEGEPCGD